MYSKRQLMLLGPALLAALTLGPISVSQASATPEPVPPVASNLQSSTTVDPPPPPPSYNDPHKDPRGYWDGYLDGYRAAGQDCKYKPKPKPKPKSGEPQNYIPKMTDYQKGWLHGYEDGHEQFCGH